MKIKVLGTRGEIKPSAPHHVLHSGVLVDGKLLLDLGEAEFLEYRPKAIFLTHLHPDHAFFVVSKQPVDIDIPTFAPEESGIVTNLKVITDSVSLDSYEITPVPTHHSKLVKSTAYLVAKGKERFLYTGDIIWINREYHPLLSGLDLVITDGSYIRKGGLIRKDKITGQLYGHAGIPDLVHLFREFTSNILLVHFGSWFYTAIGDASGKLKELGLSSGVKLYAGYDSEELDLAELG